MTSLLLTSRSPSKIIGLSFNFDSRSKVSRDSKEICPASDANGRTCHAHRSDLFFRASLRLGKPRGWISVSRCFFEELPQFSESLNNDDIPRRDFLLGKISSLAVLEVSADGENNLDTLDEDNGHMTMLPSLQVQSLKEQEVVASTPAHQEGLYALYGSYFVGNVVEQIWQFAWPSAVALLHDSLLPVIIVNFISKFVVFVCGPWVGAKMDCLPRVLGFNILTSVQAVAQIVSVGAVIYALKKPSLPSCMLALLVQPWFIVLVVMSAIERLTGLACGVAFEWDWVVLLAGTNRPIALAEANAALSRTDLVCEMAATCFYGILLSKYHPVTCLILAASLVLGSLPVQIFLVYCTSKLSKGILDRPKFFKQWDMNASEKSFAEQGPGKWGNNFDTLKRGWMQYFSQPALPASFASVLLFFNVGLAPGSLMTSFLTQRGLNPSVIGLFSGMGALMGFGATFLSAALVRRLGLLKAGAAGLILQAVLLAVAVTVYWSSSFVNPSSYTFFLALVIFSRLGHFIYEIIKGQILQTAVHPSLANTVGATEISLSSLAELLILGVAIMANDVSHFGSLTLFSLAAVMSAATLYCRWMASIPLVLASPLEKIINT